MKHLNYIIQDKRLMKEWNYEKNRDLLPESTTCKNKRVVWWKCSECGCEWKNSVALRTKGFGRCPNCDNKIIKN